MIQVDEAGQRGPEHGDGLLAAGEHPPRLPFGLAGGDRGPAGRGVPLARVGHVPRQLRVDLGRPEGSAAVRARRGPADQPPQQGPAQIGVDAEPVEPHRAVQQPGQQRQVLAGRGDARERPEVGQLGIRAGFRREEQAAQRARRQGQPRLPPARVGEPARRRARLAQQRLHDADVAHRGDTRQHQPHVIARRHLPVAAHVPGRRPAQRRGQRVGERADRVHQRAQRMLIQPDLGVAEVVVVDQHQVGARLPGQLSDHRARPGHVGLDPQPARQPVGGPVVQADRRSGASAAADGWARPPAPPRTR